MRPRIKRTVEPIEAPDGESERALLEALDGSHSLAQLEDRFGAQEVGDTIARMQELDLVEDAADDELVPAAERERFDRQFRYFSDLGRGEGRRRRWGRPAASPVASSRRKSCIC